MEANDKKKENQHTAKLSTFQVMTNGYATLTSLQNLTSPVRLISLPDLPHELQIRVVADLIPRYQLHSQGPLLDLPMG